MITSPATLHSWWSGRLSTVRVGAGFLVALVGLPTLTLAGVTVRSHLDLSSVLLVFLLLVVAIAIVGGPWPAVIAAGVAFLLVNYYFTAPLHTLRIGSANTLLSLVVFVIVAAAVSLLVVVVAARTEQVRLSVAAAARASVAIEGDRTRAALLAAVSHDLRSPLASAKASVGSLLATDVHFGAADTLALLNTADESIDRLIALVEDLLQMSRLRAGQLAVSMEEVDLSTVVGDAIAFLRVPTDVVAVSVADDATTVWADETLLQRVIANLLTNALRYSPPDRFPEIRARRVGDRVDLSIVDFGPGVAESQQETMFEPFQRLGDTAVGTGVGLGLAIARGLCEAMAAWLYPGSTPGGGLTMHVGLATDERSREEQETDERSREEQETDERSREEQETDERSREEQETDEVRT